MSFNLSIKRYFNLSLCGGGRSLVWSLGVRLTTGVPADVKENENENTVFTIKHVNRQFLELHLMAMLCLTCSFYPESLARFPPENRSEWVDALGFWVSENSLQVFNKLFSSRGTFCH